MKRPRDLSLIYEPSFLCTLFKKSVFRHFIALGFECLQIPIRAKFEFEVKERAFVPDSLSIHTLYNRKAIEKRYPQVKLPELDSLIEKTVKEEINDYLKECCVLKDCKNPFNHL